MPPPLRVAFLLLCLFLALRTACLLFVYHSTGYSLRKNLPVCPPSSRFFICVTMNGVRAPSSVVSMPPCDVKSVATYPMAYGQACVNVNRTSDEKEGCSSTRKREVKASMRGCCHRTRHFNKLESAVRDALGVYWGGGVSNFQSREAHTAIM